MAYNGTVYCSYCGQKGHNKRGCPSRKEYIANNPDSWQARREAEQKRMRQARGRRCSYCHREGHTTRTCDKKKADRQLLTQKLAKSRREILDVMANNGLGIGALVEVKRYSWGDYPAQLALVTSIDWRDTDNFTDVHFNCSFVDNPTQTFLYRHNLDKGETFFVLSRASIDSIEKSAPLKWLNGSLYDEETYFPKGGRRQWWHFDE